MESEEFFNCERSNNIIVYNSENYGKLEPCCFEYYDKDEIYKQSDEFTFYGNVYCYGGEGQFKGWV